MVRDEATANLSSTTEIYNNHAALKGDDIYLEGESSSITFSKVGSDWYLDGDPDCEDQIDGWYYDGQAGIRWGAHDPYYVFEYTTFENGVATITGSIALKSRPWHQLGSA